MVMLCIFFFKQEAAYEVLRGLVGSEVCIRDSVKGACKIRDQGFQLCFGFY